MPLTTILFDLDGTLLPMDQEAFVKAYFSLLTAELAPHGYQPEQLIAGLQYGMKAMMTNCGPSTNEDAFWDAFTKVVGEAARQDIPLFEEFYRTRFSGARSACPVNPRSAAAIAQLRSRGLTLALATNPFFPRAATQQRIAWAGLQQDDFALYTTYEDYCCCKPNTDYFLAVTNKLGVKPEECLMVGNDVQEDMIARNIGMRVFLLHDSDCIINRTGEDVSALPQGSFDDLIAYVDAQLAMN